MVNPPNGFGIVNNQNIVPASKERVERLIATIEKQRDDTIILLLEKLRKKAQWVDSDAGRYWAETLFPNIELFQQWADSDTAQLYTPPVFVNKKEAQGYFF